MSNRFLASFSAALAVVALASAPAIAQTRSNSLLAAKEGAKTWTPPKTADGVPDISGIFTNSVVTPLERPKDLGAKEFFTPEEADAYAKKQLAVREATGREPTTTFTTTWRSSASRRSKTRSPVPFVLP